MANVKLCKTPFGTRYLTQDKLNEYIEKGYKIKVLDTIEVAD